MKKRDHLCKTIIVMIGVLASCFVVMSLILVSGILPGTSGSKAEDYLLREGESESGDTEAEQDKYLSRRYDFAKLKSINKDIVGWITVPGTNINYPVCQGNTSSEYLYKDYKGNRDPKGSVFILPQQSFSSDTHMLIYGHNVQTPYMFGAIKSYEDESFFKNNNVFYVYIPEKNYRIKIFSFFTAHDGSEVYQYGFEPDSETYCRWLDDIKEKSWYDTDVQPYYDRQCFTLSTCVSGDDRLERRVLSGTVDAVLNVK